MKTKERTLLGLNVVFQDKVSSVQVSRDLHQSKSWTLFDKKDMIKNIIGLRIKQKIDRLTGISRDRIPNKELKESHYGWTIKQMEMLIVKNMVSNIILFSYTISFLNEFKQRILRMVHVNTASQDEKERFKKGHLNISGRTTVIARL